VPASARPARPGQPGPPNGSRRTWGWHRLADEWAARIVAAAEIRPGELVLDIGAGTGALTSHLVRAGARVVAVELHPGRAELLRRRFPHITVIEADVRSLPLPGRPFRVVANPPYNITADLLHLLLTAGPRLLAADLVLQRAVVRKYSEHSDYEKHSKHSDQASHRTPRTHRLSAGLNLPRRAFSPPPHVDSAVLQIRRR
jgi:23S rRNA (adenine-N6)-dimethyltransferase